MSIIQSLFNPTTLVPRLARAIAFAASAATVAANASGASWKTIGAAVGLAFLGGLFGAGEPNAPTA